LSLAVQLLLFIPELQLQSDWSKKWFEILKKILFRHPHVPVKKEEQLPLHQINLGQSKAESLERLDTGVPCPMFVLWT
jgi:hypothetical protein